MITEIFWDVSTSRDPNATLRLTVSDDIELRNRLMASAGWYDGVRKDYGGK